MPAATQTHRYAERNRIRENVARAVIDTTRAGRGSDAGHFGGAFGSRAVLRRRHRAVR